MLQPRNAIAYALCVFVFTAAMLPAPAASATPMPPLPKEDSAFAELLLPPVSPPCVEVRIHQFLSSQHLDQPIQFGLFAKHDLSAGDVLTPYGGLLRHRSDYSSGDSKSHGRSIRGDGASLVLDGLPLANMLLRPTPHTAEGLHKLVDAGIEQLLPTSPRCSEADVQRFQQSPFGFMANNAPASSCNVNVTYKSVRIAGCSYEVPMLKASRAIKASEEILSVYHTGGSPSPPPLARDPGLTLVLGMAFVNESFVSSSKAQSGTSIAVVRDRARLLELKKMGHEIITLNKDNTPEQCAPQPHVHAAFSRLAVNELLQLCQGRGLRAIYADYIRFPGAYNEAYRSFLKDMLPAMIDKGLVGPSTQLIILNKEDLFQTCPALSAFTRSPLDAADYPLYAATDKVDQEQLGAYTNQTASLPATRPFVCFQQSHQAPSSSAAAAHASSSASASSSSSSAHAAAPQHFPPDYLARRAHMGQYGWVLFHPDEKRQQLAQQWLQWSLQQEESQWELERGDWLQTVATEDNAEGVYHSGEVAGHKLLVDALGAVAYELKLVAQKVMKSPPGKGEQNDHFDAKTLAEAQGCYTVIFYLTAGDSTALPTTPHDPTTESTWFRHGTKAATKLRSQISLETHHVEPGCALVLTHKVLHKGPRNTTATDRITLFQHWVPQAGPNAVRIPNSDVQRVPLGI